MKTISACYLRSVLNVDNRRKIVDHFVEVLRRKVLKFSHIVATGVSGAAIAFSLADRLSKNVIFVRKQNDERHSAYEVENYPIGDKPFRAIFVDDLVHTGSTIIRTMQNLRKCYALRNIGRIIINGFLFYAQDGFEYNPCWLDDSEFEDDQVYLVTHKYANTICDFRNNFYYCNIGDEG